MKPTRYGNLTIEIPDNLDSYNSDHQLTIKNNAAEDVEIKLELKPSSTENIKESWYKIEPEKLIVQGQQEAGVVLRITDTPRLSKSTDEELEVVKLIVSGNPGQQEKLLWSYNLIIPPINPETPIITLVQVAEEVKTNRDRLTRVETLLREKQDLGEIQTLQTKVNELETENASLKQQLINHQSDIIQLEQALITKIQDHKAEILKLEETLTTALQQEQVKINRLLELETKKRRLTEDLGNGITLELVEIPRGKFLMGGVREITLQPFLMGKYPITQEQWFAIMGNNPSNFPGNKRPVNQVNWAEAREFCEKLSAYTGRKYQLPSESQWEYACRANTTTKFFFGNDEKELDKYAWYDKNSNGETHPVGEKLPNPWGLYDIYGNVWEWCQDGWQEGYNHIPVNGTSAWVRDSNHRCLRGASWGNESLWYASDRRHKYISTGIPLHVGFRVVIPLDAF